MKKLVKRSIVAVLIAFMCAFVAPSVLSTVPQTAEAASIKISKSKLTLVKGASKTLKISGTSSKVTWSSNKNSVAAVSSKGKVTAKKKGTAIITAKVNGKKYTCKVIVEAPKISLSSVTLTVGSTKTLKVTGTTQTVTWSSGKKSVATVSNKGKVKAKKAGTAIITAKVGGKKYTCKVTVKKVLSVSTTDITLAVGDTESFNIVFTGEGSVSFGTNTDIVSGDFGEWDGDTLPMTITGVSAGTTTIVIRHVEGSESCTINVTVTSTVSTNIKKIKSTVLKNGYTNTDGNKVICLDQYSSVSGSLSSAIIYEVSEDRLKLLSVHEYNGSATTAEMYLDFPSAIVKPNVLFVNDTYNMGYSAKATVTASAFTTDTTVRFTVITSTGLTNARIQTLANSYLQTAFSGWELLMIKKFNMTLSDIGFTSYQL